MTPKPPRSPHPQAAEWAATHVDLHLERRGLSHRRDHTRRRQLAVHLRPLGRRTAKQRLGAGGAIGERITFTWDGTRLVEQATMDGHMSTWDYVPGTHRLLTQADRHSAAEYDTRFHAIITDVVGTPTELVTPDGRIAWQHRTTVWGTGLATPPGSTSVGCPLRFPGQYRDPETCLARRQEHTEAHIEVWQLLDDPKATVTYRPFSKSGGATIDYNGVDGLDMKRFHIPQHGN